MDHAGPIEDSYWAADALLAGPYPFLGLPERADQRAALRALLGAGIRTVIDLRTPAEPPSVRVLLSKLDDEAAWVGIPIVDGAAPSRPALTTILDVLDASIQRGRPAYVHCQGGRGRTGTVVAAWWIRHRLHAPEEALAELGRRRQGLAHGDHPSPETAPQLRLVRSWSGGL